MRLDIEALTVTLDHDEVPGVLQARRTVFLVHDPEVLRQIRVGDWARFGLAVAPGSHGLLVIESLEGAEPPPRRGPGEPTVADLPAYAVVTVSAAILMLWAGVTYAGWRVLRDVESRLVAVRHAQEQLQDHVRGTAGALVDIGAVLQRTYLPGIRQLTQATDRCRVNAPDLFIVRLGKDELFDNLRNRVEDPNRVHVIWDRRRGVRRLASVPVVTERRRMERRQAAPPTWNALGFIFLPRRPGG